MYKLSKKDHEFLDEMRGKYDPSYKWYGIMTHAGREREIKQKIQDDITGSAIEEILLPEIQSCDNKNSVIIDSELLFPSYIFARCRMNDEIYMAVSGFENVFRILGRAWRIPTFVEDVEIEHLKGILKLPERPQLVARTNKGDIVEVADGLLEGLIGRVIESNPNSLKLETYFSFLDFGQSIVVVVPRSRIKPVKINR